MPYQVKDTLNHKSIRADQPERIKIPLKEHQKTMLHACQKLESMRPIQINADQQLITQMGVVGDKVGSGKSYDILALIANRPYLTPNLGFSTLNDNHQIKLYPDNSKLKHAKLNILCVPHGIVEQWRKYITGFTDLNVVVVNNHRSLKAILKDYALDENGEEDVVDLIIKIACESIGQAPPEPMKKKTASSGRDTKYYRLLDSGMKADPQYEKLISQYGTLDMSKLKRTEIILVSSTMYNEVAFYLRIGNHLVDRLIFDEADSINIPNNLQVPAIFYWFVTSSLEVLCNPKGVEKKVTIKKTRHRWNGPQTYEEVKYIKEKAIKSTGFIKNTFEQYEGNFSRDYFFLKNENKFIEDSFTLPDPITYIIICLDNLHIKVLNGIVSNDILRMLNAGDVESAIGRLSVEQKSEDNIIKAVTSKLEDKIKNVRSELEVKKQKVYVTPKAKQEALERSHKRIAELKSKIRSIEKRISEVEQCEICYDTITRPTVTGCCQNVFCFECLAMALSGKSVCPKCRSATSIQEVMVMGEEKEEAAKPKKKASKDPYTDLLEEIQEESKKKDKNANLDEILKLKALERDTMKKPVKILIFSEYDNSFNSKIINKLETHKLRHGKIKGNGMVINSVLRKYRGEELDVLLVNSRYFGAGINLENTTDIIILHRMGADLEKQVIGRAQRLGRTTSLRIWKLYYNNEAYETVN